MTYKDGLWGSIEDHIVRENWIRDRKKELANLNYRYSQRYSSRLGAIEIYATANVEDGELPFEFCSVLSLASRLYPIWIMDVPSLLQFIKEVDAYQIDASPARPSNTPRTDQMKPRTPVPPAPTPPLSRKTKQLQDDYVADNDQQAPEETHKPLETVTRIEKQPTLQITPQVPVKDLPDLLFVGTQDGIIRALQADTGISSWEYALPHQIATVFYWQQILFIATRSDHHERQQQHAYIYALHAQDGSLLWSTRLDGATMISELICDRDIICITTDMNKSTIFGLNAFNGSLLWKDTATSRLNSVAQRNILTARDGVVYLSSTSTGLEALNIENGTTLWKISELVAVRQLVLTPEYFYVLHQVTAQVDGVTIIDREHKTVLKRQSYPQQFNILLLTEQGIAYAVRDDQQIYAYTIEDDRLLWQSLIPPLDADMRACKAVTSGLLSPCLLNQQFCYYRLLLLQTTHRVTIEVAAHTPQNGQQCWRQHIPLNKPPALGVCHLTHKGDLLYLTTPQGLYVLHTSNGTLLGRAFQDSDFSPILPVLSTSQEPC